MLSQLLSTFSLCFTKDLTVFFQVTCIKSVFTGKTPVIRTMFHPAYYVAFVAGARLLSPLVHALCAAFIPSRQTNLQGTFSVVKAVDSFFYGPMILHLNGFIYEMKIITVNN